MIEIGSIVDGKYKILHEIGRGGMSVVYLAMNERANKQWAIKELNKNGIQNYETVKQNLIVETDMLKKFNHPNLPSIIDVIDNGDTFLIVMDYIEGISLKEALKRNGAQRQEDVIEWAKQLCDVLGYLHSRKPPIIYRDMKPSNVMLKPDGNVMLIDFGTAREFKESKVEDTTCLGTIGYAAPEQFGGQGQTDPRTDIYCLGATMYHLVTGHDPSASPYEMYPIRQWDPKLSSGFEEIILKCTQKNPNDRYQSCAELLYALDHYTDLDKENKKVQTLKWNTFLSVSILTVVMLVLTIIFRIALSTQKANTYDNLIQKAVEYEGGSDSATLRGKASLYRKAIDTDPSRPEAYLNLMKYCVGYDTPESYKKYGHGYAEMIENLAEPSPEGTKTNLSIEEREIIADVINEYGSELKKEHPDCYMDLLVYHFAQKLFFDYSGKVGDSGNRSGKIAAGKYYAEVADKETGSPTKLYQRRAKVMETFSKNHQNPPSSGTMDATGEIQGGFLKYWDDLMAFSDSEEIKEETIKAQLMIYRFTLSDMYTYVKEFAVAKVPKQEMVDKLQEIYNSAKVLYEEQKDEGEIKRLWENIEQKYDALGGKQGSNTGGIFDAYNRVEHPEIYADE